MASRFKKLGVTAVGAVAGAYLTSWAVNSNDRSVYKVSNKYNLK